MGKKKLKIKRNIIQLDLSWWQMLIIAVVLITITKIDPMIVFEAIKEVARYWLS